ncbi:hypothetical protein RMT89_43010, partial [Streptomyces sp. P17]
KREEGGFLLLVNGVGFLVQAPQTFLQSLKEGQKPGGEGGEKGEGHLGPHPAHGKEELKEEEAFLVGKAIEKQALLPELEVGVDRHLLALF